MPTNDEYCDYSDLRKEECSHCRTGVKDAGAGTSNAPHRRGPLGLDVPRGDAPVPATYNGICGVCRKSIRKADGERDADWIVRGEQGWIHEDCEESV
jgi:hypothetical protein